MSLPPLKEIINKNPTIEITKKITTQIDTADYMLNHIMELHKVIEDEENDEMHIYLTLKSLVRRFNEAFYKKDNILI